MRGHLDCIHMLLHYKVSMYPRTHEGDTPRDLADRYGHLDIIEFYGKRFKMTILRRLSPSDVLSLVFHLEIYQYYMMQYGETTWLCASLAAALLNLLGII